MRHSCGLQLKARYLQVRIIASLKAEPSRQGRIKGVATEAIAPGPHCKGALRDKIYLFQKKYSLERFRDSEAMQEYNSILYSYVAFSIKTPNSNWFLHKFDCLPVFVIAID